MTTIIAPPRSLSTDSGKTVVFTGHQLRVIEIEGAPWFVAADVCRVLGLHNPSQALKPLDTDEKTLRNNEAQGKREAPYWNCISESGLYKLVMRAHRKNPEAAKFQDWVTGTVLPAIRKDGGYLMGEETAREDTRHLWTMICPTPSEKGRDKGSH